MFCPVFAAGICLRAGYTVWMPMACPALARVPATIELAHNVAWYSDGIDKCARLP